MFRVARVLHAVSPFAIFLMDQKSNPQLAGVSIAKRAKLLSNMYNNLSVRQRKDLRQRARAHPGFGGSKAKSRKSTKRTPPADSDFAKFVKENYDKVRALNYRKRFVALSQLYELQKPVKIADTVIRVPITSAAGRAASGGAGGGANIKLTPTTTNAGTGVCTTTVDTSACKAATDASGGATTTAPSSNASKTAASGTSSPSSQRARKSSTSSGSKSTSRKSGGGSSSRRSGKTSTSSSSSGKQARKTIKQAAHATKQEEKTRMRPRGGKYLRDGITTHNFVPVSVRKYTRPRR